MHSTFVDSQIGETIGRRLADLEREHGVEILYACESGSRAWGFPSADSDYDVRFIYAHDRDWYLRLDSDHCRDVIECPPRDGLDVNGWDVRKALRLMGKCNPSLLEWLRSPIVYRQNGAFMRALRVLIPRYFSPRACFHHYAHMARGNFRQYLRGDVVRLKKYLYVLRPILAIHWIEREVSPVPVRFDELVEATVRDAELKAAIRRLVAQKRRGFESDLGPRIDIISRFIEDELARLDDAAPGLSAPVPDLSPLNALFRSVLDGAFR